MQPDNFETRFEIGRERIANFQAEAQKEALLREARETDPFKKATTLNLRHHFGFMLMDLGRRLTGNSKALAYMKEISRSVEFYN